MRVLVAPDKFRGTLTAAEAARAIAAGWKRADPSAQVTLVPMADGGEGTLEALVAALGGETRRTLVTGPLLEPVEASFGLVRSGGAVTGVVEMASASGLALVAPERRDPKRTTTRGTGELILAASGAGARSLIVCIGGSATNDAGVGMAQALGIRCVDVDGLDLGPGGAAVARLARIEMGTLDPAVRGADVVVATDVDNPLTGPNGAAAVYGPQKGATPSDVRLLDRALVRFAAVARRDLAVEIEHLPGAGAAGGLGGGLVAFLGARLRPGVEVVMEAVGLASEVATSDIVVTGEGSFDAQSMRGKAPSGVLAAAARAGVSAVVLAGRVAPAAERIGPNVRVRSMVERFGEEASERRAAETLAALAESVATELRAGKGLSS